MAWRNKRKTGIIVLVVGVICVGVGFLFNYSLPRSLQNRILDEMCVSGVNHPKYEQWTNVSESTTKIYYWHIKNKEGFLYRREIPQLVERGPYVYTTFSRKVDVMFDAFEKVTYKIYNQQKFNQTMTTKLCPTCKEKDKLNIINMAHLGLMSKVQTADAFSLVFIPVAIGNLLRDMDSKLGNRNATLKQLGNATSSLLKLNHSFNPEFGSWISNIGDPRLCGGRCGSARNYTVSEMRGLYDALTNATVLGPPQNETVYAECAVQPHLKTCGIFLWLANLALSVSNPNATSPAFNQTEAQRLVKHALCPSPAACFSASTLLDMMSLMNFINSALRGYVLWSMDHNNYGLVTTKCQDELALGYVMNKFRFPPAYPNGVPSRGVLTNHSSSSEAVQKSDSTTLHSCNSTSEEKKFSWAAYNGASKLSRAFNPNASESELEVRGHQGRFLPAKQVTSCGVSFYEPVKKKYEIFIAQLKRRATLVYDKQVTVKNLTLNRFRLDKSLVTRNNRTVLTSGFVDMSSVYGFPALIGFPRFLHGEQGLGKRIGVPVADPEKHGSFIDIEPFTGTALRAVFRFQVSAVVSRDVVSSQFHPRPLNVSYVEDNAPLYQNVIPLFWTETTQEVSVQQAKMIESQVFGTLRKSCGVMVALSIAGGLCLFSGTFLVALSVTRSDNTVSMDLSED